MSWDDDEDWDVPTLDLGLKKSDSAGDAFADEIDEVVIEEVTLNGPSEATLAAKAKKLAKEEETLANQVKFDLQANEDGEAKKRREREQIEAADNALTEELMGGLPKQLKAASLGSGAGGLASIPISTKADHTSFGIMISKKLAKSTPVYITSFFKSLTERLPEKMTVESLDDIIANFTKLRKEKVELQGEVVKAKKSTKSKKQEKAEKQRVKDVFGASDYVDEHYEAYGNMEDDFM